MTAWSRPAGAFVPRERRRSARRLAALGATLPAVLIAVSCTAAPGDESTTSPGVVAIEWEPCGAGLQCADVPVPVDWADPDGDELTLAVIRRPASMPDERIGAMFVNPGGPGGSGVGFVRDAGEQIDEWGGGRFDVISWDPRGTHGSGGVNCFESVSEASTFWSGVAIPSGDADVADFTRRTTELARRCGEVMGPLLSHISTTDTVRDLDHLRQLAGEDTLTYVGLSYGTMIGQMYANMFPDRVRAMVFDGVVDPIASTSNAAAAAADSPSIDEVFEQFLALCEQAGPPRCVLAGHGEPVTVRVGRLFEQARQGPIPVPSGAGVLTYSDLLVSSFLAMNAPGTWSDYAARLNAAVDGDVSSLANSAVQWHSPDLWASVTTSAAIACLDAPAGESVEQWPAVIADLRSDDDFSAAVYGWGSWALCASGWPAADDDRFTGPWDAETENPILLIGTRYDPATAYDNAVSAEDRLGNAVLLTHQGYGHPSFQDPSACVDEARNRYLVDLVVPEPGTVCEADQEPFS